LICIDPPSPERLEYGQDLTRYICESFGKTRLENSRYRRVNSLRLRGSIYHHDIRLSLSEQSVCLCHPAQKILPRSLDPIIARPALRSAF
jgi:hypothetical protein